MKTIGKLLKETRVKKRYSLKKISEKTKIKEEFVVSLENEKWEELPEYTVVSGFVRSIAKVLSTNENHALALLRRDYPPQKLSVNPKPDVSPKYSWSPKLTFYFGVVVILSLITGYLSVQYYKSITPPSLLVIEPQENIKVVGVSTKVLGQTDKDATVVVNNQPIIVSENGDFEVELEVSEETKEIVIHAVSRYGEETVISRRVEVTNNE